MDPDRTPPSPEELQRVETLLADWLAREAAGNPIVAAVERDELARRWYVRVLGEEKDVFTIWFDLHQRTLRYETYVLPAPVVEPGPLYEYLLRRNLDQHGAAFAIGAEDAVYLVGRLPLEAVTEGELDRILGSLWHYTERSFRTGVRLAFGDGVGRA
jgi:hypothetical protein